MGRKDNDAEPTLAEAWAMIGGRLGLTVAERGERSIRAHGTVRGRTVDVQIDGDPARSEFARFLFGLNTLSSRNRREKWATVVTVGCTNPRHAVGTITSSVDLNDPAWKPGEYDPRSGRKVVADPAPLATLIAADVHARLMSIMADVQIDVQPTTIRMEHHGTARPSSGANFVAGSVIHHYQGSPPPWPERAVVGPPWWIDLLVDIADAVDRP